MPGFRPVSSDALAQERKLKALIKAEKITSTDRTKFEELCEKFRNTCKEIREVANWPTFMGSYDECEVAADRDDLIDSHEYQKLYNKLNVLNLSAKHEGEKLGYRGAEWWLYCWKDELAAIASTPVAQRSLPPRKRS